MRLNIAAEAAGSIPACAGETVTGPGEYHQHGVYPRVCGGNLADSVHVPDVLGLSPRVRGKLAARPQWQSGAGSIPACAGETFNGYGLYTVVKVYPRVCGGNFSWIPFSWAWAGLSPRVRGKHPRAGGWPGAGGSIPACAGETPPPSGPPPPSGVYPRVCGGNSRRKQRPRAVKGLSPRVRGKQWSSLSIKSISGSIPACAGETNQLPTGYLRGWVYPRVCGGNGKAPYSKSARRGLSPRVRGKRVAAPPGQDLTGSIPACAGETGSRHSSISDCPVYPRVCGGNGEVDMVKRAMEGLSPRVRGKPPPALRQQQRGWSIPACAGETLGWIY